MKAGGFACLASLMRPADLLLPGGSPELALLLQVLALL